MNDNFFIAIVFINNDIKFVTDIGVIEEENYNYIYRVQFSDKFNNKIFIEYFNDIFDYLMKRKNTDIKNVIKINKIECERIMKIKDIFIEKNNI